MVLAYQLIERDRRRQAGADVGRPAALVTGAARGIGLAVAIRLATDHDVLRVDVLAEELAVSADDRFTDVVGDVGDEAVLRAAIERAPGRLRTIVANAGIQRDARLATMTRDHWDEVVATDLTAAFLAVRLAWSQLVEGADGRVVLVSSVAKDGNVGQANYAAAKSGLVGLGRTIALEGGPHGLTANIVCPGVIETPGTAAFRDRAPTAFGRFLDRVPAGHAGSPEDVAAVVGFLTSPDARYVNGQVVYVDGGLSCGHT
jgi:3-oxoacyl-[acyl-carrier protein] reductase